MAWFRWRKNAPKVDEQQVDVQQVDVQQVDVQQVLEQQVLEQDAVDERLDDQRSDDAAPASTLEPEPAVDPVAEPALDPVTEPALDPDPVPVTDPDLEPDLESFPEPDPVTEQLGSTTTLQVAEQVVPSDQPAPVLAWNPGLRGVVVKIVHTAPSAAGSAEDLRAALENGLAAAVGEHSPAPHDADPEYPVVLNVTIAEETVDAEVTEVLASARKQLARKAVRVRLVVDQAPLAEIA
jgi:hypothetical protein